jgi:DNA-binding GntR family transcriptional regulator
LGIVHQTIQRQRSLSQQTYDALRNSILSGQLAPGDRLIETQIASQLQVSRTPIREALRQLQQDELVVADEAGWLRVATVSEQEAGHLYDCRIALETLAVTGACQQSSPDYMAKLHDCLQESKQLLDIPLTPETSHRMLELDYSFHRMIAESSGNHCLLTLLEHLFSKMALLRVQTTQHNPRVLDIYTEHYGVYDAIRHQDVEQATRMVQQHLLESRHRVLTEIKQMRSSLS